MCVNREGCMTEDHVNSQNSSEKLTDISERTSEVPSAITPERSSNDMVKMLEKDNSGMADEIELIPGEEQNVEENDHVGVEENEDSDEDEDYEMELLEKMERKEVVKPDKEEDYTQLFAVEGEEETDGQEEMSFDDDAHEDNESVASGMSSANHEKSQQDEDYEDILSDEAGELDNGLDDLDIFNRKKNFENVLSAQEKDRKEGQEVIKQIGVYDKMVEIRISLHKLLQIAAQLPNPNKVATFNQRVNVDTNELYNKTTTNLLNLFGQADELVRKTSTDSVSNKDNLSTFSPNDASLNEEWKIFSKKREKTFEETWESVKHGSMGNNPNVAVKSILHDTDRLLIRSQTKKSFPALRLGEKEVLKLDPEQYDDTGFYQAILRGVINSKVENTSDPLAISRHWLALERMEIKKKKAVVDTKASKGRKIRYTVIPKLVGFLSKRNTATWTHEQRNQLFRGVFQS